MAWLLRVAWCWIVVGHAVALAFTAFVAGVYTYVLRTPSVGEALLQLDLSIARFILPTAASAVASTIAHAVAVLTLSRRMRVLRRVHPHRDVDTADQVKPDRVMSHPTMSLFRPRATPSAVLSILSRIRSTLVTTSATYNAEITRLFLLWEVALQTFQTNKMSQLITHQGLNRLVTIVVVMNCWFVPALQFAMRNQPGPRVRLCRLLIDSSLDVIYGVAIPFTVWYPYVRDFTGGDEIYPRLNYYMDTWYINAVSELRQVFVTSWLDFVSKVTGTMALTYRLYVISEALVAVETTMSEVALDTPLYQRSRFSKCLDALLLLWGLGVLSLHVHAAVVSTAGHDSSCLLELRPWGATGYECAALEISCSKRGIDGELAVMQSIIQTVDPDALQILIVSHCPVLEIPVGIQSLHHLTTIKIYNSTIAAWDDTASLRSSCHPFLQTLYLPRVNMSSIPTGLLAPDFPPTLWAIMLSQSNLSTLPDSVLKPWQGLYMFVMEGNTAITEMPAFLLSLPALNMLEYRGNGIATFPDMAYPRSSSIVVLDVHGNPVERLPQSLVAFPLLQKIDVSNTNVGEIPAAWTETASRQVVLIQAAGSPLCGTGSDSETESEHRKPSWAVINCTADTATGDSFYPMAHEDSWRRVNA